MTGRPSFSNKIAPSCLVDFKLKLSPACSTAKISSAAICAAISLVNLSKSAASGLMPASSILASVRASGSSISSYNFICSCSASLARSTGTSSATVLHSCAYSCVRYAPPTVLMLYSLRAGSIRYAAMAISSVMPRASTPRHKAVLIISLLSQQAFWQFSFASQS